MDGIITTIVYGTIWHRERSMVTKKHCDTLKLILERRVRASMEPPKGLFRNDKLAAALLSASEKRFSLMSTRK